MGVSKQSKIGVERPTRVKNVGARALWKVSIDVIKGRGRTSVNLCTATSCLPLLAAALPLWY